MNRQEKIKFIDQELRGLWPEWNPTEAETGAWMGVLTNFDYDIARIAIKQHWAGNRMALRRPKASDFIEKAKVLLQKSNIAVKQQEPVKLYELQRTDKLDIRCFYHPNGNLPSPDAIMQRAEYKRQRHEQIYSGQWIIVRQTETKHEDDGLRGAVAKKKAEELVLAGPDTPGKRWLLNVVIPHRKTNTEKSTVKTTKPMRVGDVLDEIPF